jgi:uncharacterized damage-inducible protein DinB
MAYAMGYRSVAAPRLNYCYDWELLIKVYPGIHKPRLLIFGNEQSRSSISPKMVDRTEWIKRQFSFELPLGMYGNVVERVRGTPAHLEDLTGGLSREILTRRDGDKWSIQEHAGHLLDLEELGMKRLDDFEAGVAALSAADMANRKTYEADHNANTIENILAQFRRERMDFVRRLDAYDEGFVQRTAIHPRLQVKIRVIDLVFFIAEHDDHHLARISELKRMFAS